MSNVRLLWIGYSGKIDHAHADVLRRLRHKSSIEFCGATIRHRSYVESEVFDESVIHHSNALFARYDRALSDFSGIIDREIYKSCAPFEGETLRMMDRLHDPYTGIVFHDSYEERRKMFLKHCAFWWGYLSKRGITHCVFNTVPHEVYDFVILNLAPLLKIRTIIVHWEKSGRSRTENTLSGQFPKMLSSAEFFVSENIADIGRWDLAKKIKAQGKLMGLNFVCSSNLRSIAKSNKNLIEKISVSSQGLNFVLALNDLKAQLKNPRIFFVVLRRILRVIKQRHSHRIVALNRYQIQNTVLYFLPFQPEENSCPRGGIFTEQILVLKMLSESLPLGWAIRVREHPDQYWRLRPRPSGFWREVAMIPRVSVVPLDEPTSESYKNAQVVAGVTGSPSIEAWTYGIPVLLFGNMFLKFAPGVFPINTVNDLKIAFSKIENDLVVQQSEIDKFIEMTEEHTFVGCLAKIPKAESFPIVTLATTTDNLESIFTSWLNLDEPKC